MFLFVHGPSYFRQDGNGVNLDRANLILFRVRNEFRNLLSTIGISSNNDSLPLYIFNSIFWGRGVEVIFEGGKWMAVAPLSGLLATQTPLHSKTPLHPSHRPLLPPNPTPPRASTHHPRRLPPRGQYIPETHV